MHPYTYFTLVWMAVSIISGIVIGLRLQRPGYLRLRRIIWLTIPLVIVLMLTAMLAVAFQWPDWTRVVIFWCVVTLAMHFFFNMATGTTMLFRRDLRLPGVYVMGNAAIIPLIAVGMMVAWRMVMHPVMAWARQAGD